jgi:hypothetical protein
MLTCHLEIKVAKPVFMSKTGVELALPRGRISTRANLTLTYTMGDIVNELCIS